ncbi:HTR-like protein [Halonotius terrestris]|uniref:HTR-like protein n=1 Tax=Halonotius terrestris TaxID=2487750 RepID=A0A8J8PBY9_9EURY|nr:HTR-like protein [Halonotius terrestris]TQQ81212.1 HTR-like protein [Halonotius terrestris]
MVDMPFGVSRLDSLLGGGVPTGSVVVLATEPGAGGRQFLRTSAAMNALATTDNERFEFYYGDLEGDDVIAPPAVHYCSLAATADSLETILGETVADEVAASAADAIHYRDFSPTYFGSSPVPPEWYLGGSDSTPSPLPEEDAADSDAADSDEADGVAAEGDPFEYSGESADGDTAVDDDPDGDSDGSVGEAESSTTPASILPALREYLIEHAAGNLVVIDAITDLGTLPDDEVAWDEVTRLLRGLTRAVTDWGGVVLVLADAEAVTPPELGALSAAATGTLQFGWETGGSKRARVMNVRELRGALSRLEREDIVQFEAEMHDRGYDLSNVKKIR